MKKLFFNFEWLLNLNRFPGFFIHFVWLALGVCILYHQKLDENFNLWFSDRLTERAYEKVTPRKLFQEMVTVEIDDASFDWLAQSYGSERISLSKLIMNIRDSNPQCIVVHFLFYGKGM